MGIDSVLSTLNIAIVYAILGFGVFMSFKILNITDLTIEASYGFGAAISAMICRMENVNVLANIFGSWIISFIPFISLIAAFIGGAFAGIVTALLHTKLKINSVLAGILTLTSFYTINIMVIKNGLYASIGLNNNSGVTLFPDSSIIKLIIMLIILLLIGVLYALFFKTRLGLSIRACGDNEKMSETQCINTDLIKIIGLALSNGLVALSGALFVQSEGYYATKIETGMMVVGVATIIIGEIVVLGKHNLGLMLCGIFVGSVIYRFIYALALRIDFIKSSYLHLITSSLIIFIMLISKYINDKRNKTKIKKSALALLESESKND